MQSRRNLLKFLAAPTLAVGFCQNRARAFSLAGELPTNVPQMTAQTLWRSPPNCYFAYPHDDAFNLATGNPILTRIDEGPNARTFLEWDYRACETRPIFSGRNVGLYGAVSEKSGELFVFLEGRRLIAVPLCGGRPETLVELRLEIGERVTGFAVAPDGGRLVFGIRRCSGASDMTKILEFERNSGRQALLCEVPFYANHFQYSPHDPSFIGFSHEGSIKLGQGRVWALRRENGEVMPLRLWSERDAETNLLLVGHERWAFDRTGAYAVAYRSSKGGPRGLYFVDALTYQAHLVSASDYDWHCNVSRDGQWAVVDTMEPRGLRKHKGRVSDIVLVDVKTGRRRWVARARAASHPWHPHPHFDPTSRRLIFNDRGDIEAGTLGCVTMVEI